MWNGRRPGFNARGAGGVEREGDAAILHQHAGVRQHQRRSRIPNRSTGCRRPRGRRASIAPIQIVSPCVRRQRPGRARAALIDAVGLGLQRSGRQKPLEILRSRSRNRRRRGRGGRTRAWSPRSAHGRASTLSISLDAEPLVDAEDHQRGEPLRRDRRVVERRAVRVLIDSGSRQRA